MGIGFVGGGGLGCHLEKLIFSFKILRRGCMGSVWG